MSNDDPALWSRMLSYLGFDGIYDPGMGVIYKTEPAQLVAFSKSAVESVEMFSTSAVRKNQRKEKINSEFLPSLLRRLSVRESMLIKDFIDFAKDINNWEKFGKKDKYPYGDLKGSNARKLDETVFFMSMKYPHLGIVENFDRKTDLFLIFSGFNFKMFVEYIVDIDDLPRGEISSIATIMKRYNSAYITLPIFINLIKRAKSQSAIRGIVPQILDILEEGIQKRIQNRQ